MSDRREHVLMLAEIKAAENGFRGEIDTGVARELDVDVEAYRAYRQVCAAIDEYELRHRGHEVLKGIPEENSRSVTDDAHATRSERPALQAETGSWPGSSIEAWLQPRKPRRVIERYLPPPLRPAAYMMKRRFDRRPDWVDRWADAISGALDDSLLTTAIERVTEPVPSLDGRSAKVCVAQLVRWASAVHSHDPERPLDEALEDALARDGDQRETRVSTQDPVPPQPPTLLRDVPEDLENRVARILELRPDLSRPQNLRQDLPHDPADDLPPSLEL